LLASKIAILDAVSLETIIAGVVTVPVNVGLAIFAFRATLAIVS
jgi:hypothetical protein